MRRFCRFHLFSLDTEHKRKKATSIRHISYRLKWFATGIIGFTVSQAVLGANKPITTPDDARALGLESLHVAVKNDGGAPLPDDIEKFVTDRKAAIQLGKAFFWDMQIGSDGVQACASCHFHAGADNRSRNQLNPNLVSIVDKHEGDVVGYSNSATVPDLQFDTRQPNEQLKREDFPFIKSLEELTLNADGTVRPGKGNSNDVVSSMGILFNRFDGVQAGVAIDLGTPLREPVFNAGSLDVRRVEPRNAPTVINAVFNFTNFWEGRATPHFNGKTSFGDQDSRARIIINSPETGLDFERISLNNASLASQALAPLTSPFEMSFGDVASGNGRTLTDIGVKLLRKSTQTGTALVPLGSQKVHPLDSTLGSLSNWPAPGIATSYEAMIKKAFAEPYWNSTEAIQTATRELTQMEANFGLFFGLSVALYERTLVSDRTPFDQWLESGHFNRGFGKDELAGLNLFVNEGQCLTCHAGPELTKASVRSAQQGKSAILPMTMANGTALYDNGFYNIAVTPTTDDIGRGGLDPFGQPMAFSRQSLFQRLGLATFSFPIFGDETLPATVADVDAAVCDDINTNGVCAPDEPISPEFQRVAVDGAFKTPGLRNSELTGPYFHNGGVATLRQVVQFYNRGGNFCRFNVKDLDPQIKPLGLNETQEEQLVAFMVALTDPRVKYQTAPFDHPELRIPVDGLDQEGTRRLEAVGAYGSRRSLKRFLQLDPQDPIFTPAGTCTAELPPADKGQGGQKP